MSFRLRRVGSFSVLVSCAALAAWGCSSDDNKKVIMTPGEAGAGGEGGALVPEGGAAGVVNVPSEAGQGGAPEVAGAAGAGGAGGAAGACTPSGNASSLTIQNDDEVAPKVCRGAYARVSFSSLTTDQTFTCCGTSDTVDQYTVKALGIYDGEGGGTLSFLIPLDAPLGTQAIALTCNPGPVANSAGVVVTDTAAPVVTAVTATLDGSTLTITGSHLGLVNTVTAVSVDDPYAQNFCFLDPDTATHTDTSLKCGFDGGINPGTYTVLVEQDDCGYAAYQPTFTATALPNP